MANAENAQNHVPQKTINVAFGRQRTQQAEPIIVVVEMRFARTGLRAEAECHASESLKQCESNAW